jgi:hypothetical protein
MRSPPNRTSGDEVLQRIAHIPNVSESLFAVLETQKLIEGEARITLLPSGPSILGELLAAQPHDSAALPAPGAAPPSG